ncbi:pilus assembly protein TadG-related protein [uncultured Serinicoccus sp.]|uniref:pilus assembly protein TadG-related protein n=1 Tax=uncultured Serinicoccus sp. TaxID=735514 RepID=UPI002604D02D|nr:pilus assembly protein TadG-related protein [uncultured Serinicoccus sp.]
MRLRRGPSRADRERGSASVWTLMLASLALIMVGLAVDASGHIHALQEARTVAREAARAGGQEIETPRGVLGQGAVATPGLAAAAANSYLSAAGVDGTATVTGPDTVQVAVTTTYSTRFLSVIGIGSLSATGTAESRITRSIEGTEQ